jgi:hypothetical protein
VHRRADGAVGGEGCSARGSTGVGWGGGVVERVRSGQHEGWRGLNPQPSTGEPRPDG